MNVAAKMDFERDVDSSASQVMRVQMMIDNVEMAGQDHDRQR